MIAALLAAALAGAAPEAVLRERLDAAGKVAALELSDGGWTLVWTRGRPHFALFETTQDPGRRRDLAAIRPERAASLAKTLLSSLSLDDARVHGSVSAPPPEILEGLRRLGYKP